MNPKNICRSAILLILGVVGTLYLASAFNIARTVGAWVRPAPDDGTQILSRLEFVRVAPSTEAGTQARTPGPEHEALDKEKAEPKPAIAPPRRAGEEAGGERQRERTERARGELPEQREHHDGGRAGAEDGERDAEVPQLRQEVAERDQAEAGGHGAVAGDDLRRGTPGHEQAGKPGPGERFVAVLADAPERPVSARSVVAEVIQWSLFLAFLVVPCVIARQFLVKPLKEFPEVSPKTLEALRSDDDTKQEKAATVVARAILLSLDGLQESNPRFDALLQDKEELENALQFPLGRATVVRKVLERREEEAKAAARKYAQMAGLTWDDGRSWRKQKR